MPGSPDLEGKIAVVTGGSGAIGQSIVHTLTTAGAQAFSIDTAAPKDSGIPWIECDVRDDASVRKAVRDVASRHGGVDVAVHAAGVSRDAVVWKLSPEDWDFIQSVNLRGAFLLIRHSLPLMRTRGAGRIILIGSINGSRGRFGTAAYSASKAGLLGLAKTVAREAGRFGIRINVIEPGSVRTPLTGISTADYSRCGAGREPGRKFRRARRYWQCRGVSLRVRRRANYRADPASGWRAVSWSHISSWR